MQDPQLAIREMERASSTLGIAGFEIGSHINDWNLDAKELYEFYEAAEDLDVCLFVHPWDMMGKEKCPNIGCPGWLECRLKLL